MCACVCVVCVSVCVLCVLCVCVYVCGGVWINMSVCPDLSAETEGLHEGLA